MTNEFSWWDRTLANAVLIVNALQKELYIFSDRPLRLPMSRRQRNKTLKLIQRMEDLTGNQSPSAEQLNRDLDDDIGIRVIGFLPEIVSKLESIEPDMQKLIKATGIEDSERKQKILRSYMAGKFGFIGLAQAVDEYQELIDENKGRMRAICTRFGITSGSEEYKLLQQALFFCEPEFIAETCVAASKIVKNPTVNIKTLRNLEAFVNKIEEQIERDKTGSAGKKNPRKSKRVQRKSQREPRRQRPSRRALVASTTSPLELIKPKKKKSLPVILDERLKLCEAELAEKKRTQNVLRSQLGRYAQHIPEEAEQLALLEEELDFLHEHNQELRSRAEDNGIYIGKYPPVSTEAISDRAFPGNISAWPIDVPVLLSEDEIRRSDLSEAEQTECLEKNDRLKKIIQELTTAHDDMERLKTADLEKEYELENLRRKTSVLRERINDLSNQNKVLLDTIGEAETIATNGHEFPPLSELEDWVTHNIAEGRLIILNKAFKEAAKSEYVAPALIFNTLSLLANEYRDQMLSGNLPEDKRAETRKTFDQKRKALGLFIGGSITESGSSGKYVDKYMATTPDGERVFLNQHVGRGNSRNPRHCLRIYFTWSPERKAVIVGHMPTHLRNALT